MPRCVQVEQLGSKEPGCDGRRTSRVSDRQHQVNRLGSRSTALAGGCCNPTQTVQYVALGKKSLVDNPTISNQGYIVALQHLPVLLWRQLDAVRQGLHRLQWLQWPRCGVRRIESGARGKQYAVLGGLVCTDSDLRRWAVLTACPGTGFEIKTRNRRIRSDK